MKLWISILMNHIKFHTNFTNRIYHITMLGAEPLWWVHIFLNFFWIKNFSDCYHNDSIINFIWWNKSKYWWNLSIVTFIKSVWQTIRNKMLTWVTRNWKPTFWNILKHWMIRWTVRRTEQFVCFEANIMNIWTFTDNSQLINAE